MSAFDSVADKATLRSGDGKNAVSIVCPSCDCVVLKPSHGEWQTNEQYELPKANANAKEALKQADKDTVGEVWKVNTMMDFENVGFTMTVENRIKYLCCADCEGGPLGIQLLDSASPQACYVAAGRVSYRL